MANKTRAAKAAETAQAPREAAAVWESLQVLLPWVRNPRNDANIPRIMASLRRFGFASPVVARKENNEIIVGHKRLTGVQRLTKQWREASKAQRELWTTTTDPAMRWHPEIVFVIEQQIVPVRYRDDLTADEAHKLAIADNVIGEKGDWDTDEYGKLLDEWRAEGESFDGMGIAANEIRQIAGVEYETEIEEIDVSDARAEFFISVHGPLPEQAEVLEELRKRLVGMNVEVTITTTEL